MKKFKFHLKHLKNNGLIIVTAFLAFMLVNVCTDIEASAVSTVASKDGVPIAFQVHGQGKGDIALVFIHGWCCDRSYWKKQIPYFAAKYQVVTIDLAGHGDSGTNRSAWTMKAFGEDVTAVVKKLGLKKVILIGHSMGGAVIAEAARLIPQQVIGLVGVDIFHNVELKYSPEQIKLILAPVRADFVKDTQNAVRNFMFTPNSDPQLVKKIADDMSSAPAKIGVATFEEYLKHDLLSTLKAVQAPTHCINSNRFLPTNIEAGRRHFHSFKVKLMANVGHFNMIEDPETFNHLLDETVKELIQLKK
jgi:pimeloyl-ACP methyl ester carboxylesterase